MKTAGISSQLRRADGQRFTSTALQYTGETGHTIITLKRKDAMLVKRLFVAFPNKPNKPTPAGPKGIPLKFKRKESP